MEPIVCPAPKSTDEVEACDSTLTDRIAAAPNKNELLVQLVRDSNVIGVQAVLSLHPEVNGAFDNFRVWRLCESDLSEPKQQILRLFLKRSSTTLSVHIAELHGAIVRNDVPKATILLTPLSRDTINCSQIKPLFITACVTSNEITALMIKKWNYNCDQVCTNCIRNQLSMLHKTIVAFNKVTFEAILSDRTESRGATRLKGNMELLRTACLSNNKHAAKMLLETLPFDLFNSEYLPHVLSHVTSVSDPELTDMVFGAFGDDLEASLIKPEYLVNACTNGQRTAAIALLAKGVFSKETIALCGQICTENGFVDITTMLFDYLVKITQETAVSTDRSVSGWICRKLFQ
ncbi:Hypothetical protein MVR_LOCUS62 [uncultured virus]|nr:Hypothetical protein MVR_LOCUS62 [uncultured virus]